MMADETTPETDGATEPQTEMGAESAAESGADVATETAPAADPVEALTGEVADLKNRLLRTLAEMENLRRRTEREIADARQYAVANFARDVLTVGDNLRRAIDAVPQEKRDGSDPALSTLIEGVEVTERGLEQALTKFGVRRVETTGQKFDPAVHQAMFEVDAPEMPPGSVVEEIQAGYAIGERVLRPALVAIARRPKPVVVETARTSDGPDG